MDLLVDVKELQREAEQFASIKDIPDETKIEEQPVQAVSPSSIPPVEETKSETIKEGKQEVDSSPRDEQTTADLPNKGVSKNPEEGASDMEDNDILLEEGGNTEELLSDISMRKKLSYLQMQTKVKEMTKQLKTKAEEVETALQAKKIAASLAPKSSKKMSVESITILQQRVVSELLSTYDSAKVILQFTDSVFCEKMENPKIISICIKLLQLVFPICNNCIQRCDSLLAVDSSDFAKRFNLVDNSMVQWILENPTLCDFMQKSYETMHENKGLWGVTITCMALGMGYFSKEVSDNNSVGVLATLGTIFGAISVYFLGKEISLRQNPRLIHQLRKLREIVENTDDEKTQETLMQLIKTLRISQKVSLTYTEFVELATTECSLCLEPLHAASIGQPNTCSHMFHYRELERLAKNKECPICRKPFDYVKQVTLKKPG